jgi:hypothetical protein
MHGFSCYPTSKEMKTQIQSSFMEPKPNVSQLKHNWSVISFEKSRHVIRNINPMFLARNGTRIELRTISTYN